MDCEHGWKLIKETDYGELDYSSYGGPVDHFVVSLYQCELCGQLKKESRGEVCGNPDVFLEINDEDIEYAENWSEK